MKKYKVGIIGYGVVGKALANWFSKNQPNVKCYLQDPYLGYHGVAAAKASGILLDAYFVQVPSLTLRNGRQDLSMLKEALIDLPDNAKIWIRTTITIDSLNELRAYCPFKKIHYFPEFLSDKTADEDFGKEPLMLVGDAAEIRLLKKIFSNHQSVQEKKPIVLTDAEAILAKYWHNAFGALKVTYFNCLYETCNVEDDVSYEKVRDAIVSTGHVSKIYTNVPGNNGKFGYGGKCFPKDVDALAFIERHRLGGRLLDAVSNINKNIYGEKNYDL